MSIRDEFRAAAEQWTPPDPDHNETPRERHDRLAAEFAAALEAHFDNTDNTPEAIEKELF
ncbi:hypothetical protein GCM10027039_01790 [Terrabacter koreensis]